MFNRLEEIEKSIKPLLNATSPIQLATDVQIEELANLWFEKIDILETLEESEKEVEELKALISHLNFSYETFTSLVLSNQIEDEEDEHPHAHIICKAAAKLAGIYYALNKIDESLEITSNLLKEYKNYTNKEVRRWLLEVAKISITINGYIFGTFSKVDAGQWCTSSIISNPNSLHKDWACFCTVCMLPITIGVEVSTWPPPIIAGVKPKCFLTSCTHMSRISVVVVTTSVFNCNLWAIAS